MDEKFNRRFTSFCNSLDALSEAKNRQTDKRIEQKTEIFLIHLS